MFQTHREKEKRELKQFHNAVRIPYQQYLVPVNPNLSISVRKLITKCENGSKNPCVIRESMQAFILKAAEIGKTCAMAGQEITNLFKTKSNDVINQVKIQHHQFNDYVRMLFLCFWLCIVMTTTVNRTINAIVVLPDLNHIRCFKQVCNL